MSTRYCHYRVSLIDYIEFIADMDLLVAMSTCPQGTLTTITYRLYRVYSRYGSAGCYVNMSTRYCHYRVSLTDYIEFIADMDLLVAMSTCPQGTVTTEYHL